MNALMWTIRNYPTAYSGKTSSTLFDETPFYAPAILIAGGGHTLPALPFFDFILYKKNQFPFDIFWKHRYSQFLFHTQV